jgi:bifunctional non-homologous end joining protein LigD
MATGSAGYHVIAPLDRRAGFDEVRDLAGGLAARLAATAPDTLTTEQRIAKRGDRIYLDVNRNAYGQTAIAPYSTRARDTGPIAVPIELGELSRVAPEGFDMRGVRRRLARKDDPWRDLHRRPGSANARSRLEQLPGR